MSVGHVCHVQLQPASATVPNLCKFQKHLSAQPRDGGYQPSRLLQQLDQAQQVPAP